MPLSEAPRGRYRWLWEGLDRVRALFGPVAPKPEADKEEGGRAAERARFLESVREGEQEARALCAASKHEAGDRA